MEAMVYRDVKQLLKDHGPFNRIISLVPSLTETVIELGATSLLIGRTVFCIHPGDLVKDIAKFGGTKKVQIDKCIEAAPDLILANIEENEKDQIEALSKNIPVYLSEIRNFQDLKKLIHDLGLICNKGLEKSRLILKLILSRAEYLKSKSINAQKVAYFIWYKPWMVSGGDTFINTMLEEAGFSNVLKERKRYPKLENNEIIELPVDLLLLSSEPFPFKEKHRKELNQLLPDIPVIMVDGEMFSWYGSHILKAYSYFKSLSS